MPPSPCALLLLTYTSCLAKLYYLTLKTKIVLLVEGATEKQQLPKAPISITVMAFYRGFQVLITRRMGEQAIISQVPGIVSLVQKQVEARFKPVRRTAQPALPTIETKDASNEIQVPICAIHNRLIVWREGINNTNKKHYAFWACQQKNPDGSFCKYKPEKGKK
jgi:hypothetical protein